MKTTLCLLSLLFTLECHAQSERWQLNIPITSDGVTNSGVFPDGVGGGAMLIKGLAQGTTRAVWFNASGAVILTNDFKPAGNPDHAGHVDVLRVTTKALDLAAYSYPEPFRLEMVNLYRLSAKGLQVTATPLSDTVGNFGNERLATLAAPAADKRGFFTVQLNTTNVLIRRYTF